MNPLGSGSKRQATGSNFRFSVTKLSFLKISNSFQGSFIGFFMSEIEDNC